MSDQTDIERIIENQLSDLTLPCDMRDIRIRMAGAVQQCLAGKDAEIARLKNAHESELEKGEARFVEMAESLESTREVLEEVNSHNEKTQEENLELAAEVIQLRARLSEAAVERFALESQCQKYRTALKFYDNGWDCVNDPNDELLSDIGSTAATALSDPLDLELLNRVTATLRPFVQYPDDLRDTDTIQITVTGDQMLTAAQLLKSLSPAP